MRLHLRARKRATLILAAAAAVGVGLTGVAAANPFDWWASQPHGFVTHDDVTIAGRNGVANGNVLANDFGATGVVRTSALDNPAAGSLDVRPDGTFSFTPATPGSHGTVHFTYRASDAVRLFQTNLPPLDTFGSTKISGDPKGYLINGKSIDAFVGQAGTAAATKLLEDAGVTPVGKSPYLDMGALVTQADPSGFFFGHDKIEGVASVDGGKTVYLANDGDFGLDHTNETVGPYTLHQKTLPNGKVDDGEVLAVDTSKLPLVLGSTTVTIKY